MNMLQLARDVSLDKKELIKFWKLSASGPELGIFTALLGMQTRYSDELSVCPSVRPSNA